MSRTSRIAALAIVVAGLAYGVLFCLANTASLPLDFVFFRLPEAPLSVWVLGAFIAGGVFGLAASSAALGRMRMASAAQRRRAGSASTVATAGTGD